MMLHAGVKVGCSASSCSCSSSSAWAQRPRAAANFAAVGAVVVNYSTASMASSAGFFPFPRVPPATPLHNHLQQRFLRERVRKSDAWDNVFTLENPKFGKSWPEDIKEIGERISAARMRTLMHQIQVEEMQKMEQIRSYKMPKIGLGDLVEVRYELSRSQQTFATFQGYVIKLRKRRAASAMVLKNTYDGVGVEQLLPIYSPRLLDVRVIKRAHLSEEQQAVERRHKTRNYRNQWQYYQLFRWRSCNRKYWWRRPARSGILNLENKIRTEYAHLRKRYACQRAAAGLPAYIHPGPYHIHRRQTREVRGEMERRMLVYAYDERRKRYMKLARRKAEQRWGRCFVKRVEKSRMVGSHAKDRLPGYHVLNTALS